MDPARCSDIREKINYRLDTQETRINKHSERLDLIENGYNRLDERLSNLIEKLESLNVTLKWFMGMILGGIVGFFFYAIQSGLLGRWLNASKKNVISYKQV